MKLPDLKVRLLVVQFALDLCIGVINDGLQSTRRDVRVRILWGTYSLSQSSLNRRSSNQSSLSQRSAFVYSPRTCSSGQRRRRRCRRRSRLGQGYGWHPPWPVISLIKRSINIHLRIRSTQARDKVSNMTRKKMTNLIKLYAKQFRR